MKVIITGTAQGIGKAIAELFLKAGHTVIGIDRQEKSLPAICLKDRPARGNERTSTIETAVYRTVRTVGSSGILVSSVRGRRLITASFSIKSKYFTLPADISQDM